MKFFHYRNEVIAKRLEAAANRWKVGAAERAFEKPQKNWQDLVLKRGVGYLLLFLPVVILAVGQENNILFLALLLAFIAATTFSNLVQQIVNPLHEERNYLLPLDDSTLDRQIRADLVRPFLKGLFFAMLYGAIGIASTGNLIGLIFDSGGFWRRIFAGLSTAHLTAAITGGLTYIGLLGLLAASLLPRMGWFYQIVFFGPIALFFASMVSEQVLEILKTHAHFLPWLNALQDSVYLLCFLLVSAIVAWLTRSRWWSVSPLDRTQFYESYGSLQHIYEQDEQDDQEDPGNFSAIILPKSPQGSLEKLIWKKLSLKEQALFKAVGGNSNDYLKEWAFGTALLLLLGWLGGLIWPPLIADIKTFALIIGGILIYSRYLAIPSTSTRYLEGIEISSQAVGAQFHVLPISLPLLEKLYWKEMLPKVFLLSVSLAGSLNLLTQTTSPGKIFELLILVFPTLMAGFWFAFWNQSINHWPPKKGKGTLRVKAIQLLLIVGVFWFIATCVPTFSMIERPGGPATVVPGIFAVLYLVVLRLPLRSILKDTRCDLMVQD